MSMPAAGEQHEFVVAPEPAEVAERLGLPLHTGDRVRFEVIEGSRPMPSRISSFARHRFGAEAEAAFLRTFSDAASSSPISSSPTSLGWPIWWSATRTSRSEVPTPA